MSKCVHCGKEFKKEKGIELLCPDCSRKSDDINYNFADVTYVQKEMESKFIKADNGKLEWDLMPFNELESVVKILQFGAKKYKKDNWKNCDDPVRYQNAAMRHLVAYMKGEKIDPESKESHMAHLICNALFLMWFDNESKF